MFLVFFVVNSAEYDREILITEGKMLYTVTNLYPYPDQPTRGMYNAQLFHALARRRSTENMVLVANSKPWTWSKFRGWTSPVGGATTRYVPYLHVPVVGRNRSWRFVARALKRLPMFTGQQPPSPVQRDASPSAFLASWLYPDGAGTSQALQDTETPVWVMVLGTDVLHLRNPARRKIILHQDQRISGYLCVSANLLDILADAGIERRKLHLVRNGVDTEKFQRFTPLQIAERKSSMKLAANEPTRKLLSLVSASNPPLIGWIGNFVEEKAPQDALAAFARMARSVNPGHASGETTPQLVMIGDGPLLPRLRKMVAELGVADHVHLLGKRPHAEIPTWLNMLDALCLSSHSEGMPNVVAEALACGTPVVATNVGACQEMVSGQPCCGVVVSKDIEGLANKLLEVCRNARSCAERPAFTRTWGDMADEICALIRS